jgi:hypothetical protein
MDQAIPQAAERREVWRISFRHSTGLLGRQSQSAQHNDREVLGWKSGFDQAVLYPPRDRGGTGEWVKLGPGAQLLSPLGEMQGEFALARVRLDGADCGMFARVAAVTPLRKGDRLRAEIAGSSLVFYPEAEA